MGSIGPEKILFVLVVAMIVLGPERLPKVAREIGGFVSRLRELQARMESEVRDVVGEVPEPFLNPRGWLTQQAGSILSVPGDPAAEGAVDVEASAGDGATPNWVDDGVQDAPGVVDQGVEPRIATPELSDGWHARQAVPGLGLGAVPGTRGLSAGEIGIVPGDPVLN